MRHLRAGNLSPKTVKTYSEACEQLAAFVVERGMPSEVANISREHVEAFVQHLLDTRSAATASNRFRALQQFFKWCLEEGEITESPMRNMRPPKVPEEAPAIITEAELRALLDARYDSRALTANARERFLDRFEREVDPDGALDPAERTRRAKHARSVYFTRLAIRSAGPNWPDFSICKDLRERVKERVLPRQAPARQGAWPGSSKGGQSMRDPRALPGRAPSTGRPGGSDPRRRLGALSERPLPCPGRPRGREQSQGGPNE